MQKSPSEEHFGPFNGQFPPEPSHKTSVPISLKAKQSFGNAVLELLHEQLVAGHGDEGSESLGMWKLGSHHTTP